jgi:alanine dehydrogenase
MRIGIPRELKPREGRVGLIPPACAELVRHGHQVFVEHDAGVMSGYPDEQYSAVGCTIVPTHADVFTRGDLIVKVKEPVGEDLRCLEKRHLLFCYLHLAPLPELTRALLKIGLTAIAFETVEDERGRLPLLAPMSDIAGRLSIQIGTHLLHQPQGGKGILLGGVATTRRGRVVIVGAGVAGGNAAEVAAALGAQVTVFDTDRDKLEKMRALGPNVTALYPHTHDVAEAVAHADLVVGAVLITGARAPHVISREMVEAMQPGSVVVDISVDQGGCVETTEPRTYEDPTYRYHDVVHFTVTNMPGAVPRTSSQALSAAVAPYVLRLASGDWRKDTALVRGINVEGGEIRLQALKG